ncbi:MAG: SDR family NAD(P)-dependent oxidoreductase, partial [Deltaproteobacteria bacterium]|nr:SDR family NAD(P)-dependent oxidoreductase [Deltaproteobacteria bacterium]
MSKTLLITGAGTGLGAETARQLADGNEIFIHYNASKESAEQVAADVEKQGGKAYLLQADLSKEAGCRSLIKGVYDKATKLDV